jgi:aldehyde:ferredoxin oxidoreductase
MVQGIANKILRVDLSSGRVSVDEPDESFYRTYLGGAGFVSYFLLKEVPQGVDALSPENKMIFAMGPMTGLAMPGATHGCEEGRLRCHHCGGEGGQAGLSPGHG